MAEQIRKRSITIKKLKTSVALEDEFWDAAKQIAYERKLSLQDLLQQMRERVPYGNFSSQIRLLVLRELQDRVTEARADLSRLKHDQIV